MLTAASQGFGGYGQDPLKCLPACMELPSGKVRNDFVRDFARYYSGRPEETTGARTWFAALPPEHQVQVAKLAEDGSLFRHISAGHLKRLRELENPTSLNRSAVESEAGLFLLLDLADWLEQTIPEAWNALQGSTPASSSLYLKLYNLLAHKKLASGTPWRQAILEVKANAAKLYGEGTDNHLPNFDLRGANSIAGDLSSEIDALLKNASVPKKGSTSSSGRLLMPVFSKFDALGATEIPKYVLRCVYLRPHCYPWSHEVLSTPSEIFTIAAFFDADAPVRPVRITLPDTSLANLRKFKKGVSFSISKKLREQMNSVGSAKDALDGKLSSGQSFDFGMICSLSIPIITICAFMVLMIFLIVLNLVFWWLPFFRICFPIIKPK